MNTAAELQDALEQWDGQGDPPPLSTVTASKGYRTLSPAGRVQAINQAQRNWADRLYAEDPVKYGETLREVEQDFNAARRTEVEQALAEDLRTGALSDSAVKKYVTGGLPALVDEGEAGSYVAQRYGRDEDVSGPWVTQKMPLAGADGKQAGYSYVRHAPGKDTVEVSYALNASDGRIFGTEDVPVDEALARPRYVQQTYDQYFGGGPDTSGVGGGVEMPRGFEREKQEFDTLPDPVKPFVYGARAAMARLQQRPEIVQRMGQGGLTAAGGEAMKGFLTLGAAATYGPRALFGSTEAAQQYAGAQQEINSDFEGMSRAGFEGGLWNDVATGLTREAIPTALSMGTGVAASALRNGVSSAVGRNFLARMAAMELDNIGTVSAKISAEKAAKMVAAELFGESAGQSAKQALHASLARGVLGKAIGTAPLESRGVQMLADRVTNALAFLPNSARSGLDNMLTTLNAAEEARASGDEQKAQELEGNAVMNGWAGVLTETLSENMWLNEMLVTRAGRPLSRVATDVLSRRMKPGAMSALTQRARQALEYAVKSGAQEGAEEVAAGVGGRAWMNEFAAQNRDLLEGMPQEFVTGAVMGAVMGGAKGMAENGKPQVLAELTRRGLDGDPAAQQSLANIRALAENKDLPGKRAAGAQSSPTVEAGPQGALVEAPGMGAAQTEEAASAPAPVVPSEVTRLPALLDPAAGPAREGGLLEALVVEDPEAVDGTDATDGANDFAGVPEASGPADLLQPEGDGLLVSPPPAPAPSSPSGELEQAFRDAVGRGAVPPVQESPATLEPTPEMLGFAARGALRDAGAAVSPDTGGAPAPAEAQRSAPGIEVGRVEAPPVPDTLETVTEQALLAADRNSTRRAVLITPGTPRPEKTPGLKGVKTPHGLLLYNPKKVKLQEAMAAARAEVFDARILGMSEAATAQPPAAGSAGAVAVTASTPAATNVQAELVSDPAALPAAVAAAQAAAPGAVVEVKPASQVLTERAAGATSGALPDAAATPQRAKEKAGQPPALAAGRPAAKAPAVKPNRFKPDVKQYPVASQLAIAPQNPARQLAKWRKQQKGGLEGALTPGDRKLSKERGEYNDLPTIGEFQGRPIAQDALRRIYRNGNTLPPDKAFQQLGIDDLDQGVAQLRAELRSMDSMAREQKAQDTAERQGEAFYMAISDGPIQVQASQLRKGDVLNVEGEEARVIQVKYDEGEWTPSRIVLEDGRKFGRQTIDGDMALFVEGYEPAAGQAFGLAAEDMPFSKPPEPVPGAPSVKHGQSAVRILGSKAPEIVRDLRVVANVGELNPEDYTPAQWAGIQEGGTEGFYHPASGQSVVILDNIQPRAGESPVRAVARVILHERLGHAGLGVLRRSDAQFARRWADLVARIPAEELMAIASESGYAGIASDEQSLAEEWLARHAERVKLEPPGSPLRQLWDALVAAVRRLMSAFSPGGMTAEQLAASLLQRSRKALRASANADTTPNAGPDTAVRMSTAPGAAQADSTPPGGLTDGAKKRARILRDWDGPERLSEAEDSAGAWTDAKQEILATIEIPEGWFNDWRQTNYDTKWGSAYLYLRYGESYDDSTADDSLKISIRDHSSGGPVGQRTDKEFMVPKDATLAEWARGAERAEQWLAENYGSADTENPGTLSDAGDGFKAKHLWPGSRGSSLVSHDEARQIPPVNQNQNTNGQQQSRSARPGTTAENPAQSNQLRAGGLPAGTDVGPTASRSRILGESNSGSGLEPTGAGAQSPAPAGGAGLSPALRPSVSPSSSASPAPTTKHGQSAVRILGSKAPEIVRDLRVVANVGELNPEDYTPAQWAGIQEGGTEGFYHPASGQSVVILDNIQPRAGESPVRAVARVILHERLGHAGLGVLRRSDAQFARRWADLVARIPAEELMAIASEPGYAGIASDEQSLAEEWLARHAERVKLEPPGSPLRQLWDALVAAVRRLMSAFSPGGMTAEQLAASLLQRSRKALARGGAETQSEGETRFSRVSPERDADYLAAVERGDMAAAQGMVDEAAKEAGYDVTAFKAWVNYTGGDVTNGFGRVVKSEPKQPIRVVRRPGLFPTFGNGEPLSGIAGFFAKDRSVAERFMAMSKDAALDRFALKTGRNIVIDAEGKTAGDLQFSKDARFRDAVRSGKYDSVTLSGTKDEGDVYVMLASENIKSADPVTRDESGAVIPLSQRFNEASDDIRFSRADSRPRLPQEEGVRRFGERLPENENLREEWRATFVPGTYEKFTFDELSARASALIGTHGLEGALALWRSDGPAMAAHERNALAQALSYGLDRRALEAYAAGDTAGGDAATAALDEVVDAVERESTTHAQALASMRLWYNLSPQAVVGKARRQWAEAREEEAAGDLSADGSVTAESLRREVKEAAAKDKKDDADDLESAAQRTAKRWIERLATSQSDTLSWRKRSTLSALERLIRAHLKEANPEFRAEAEALGLPVEQSRVLDALIREEHRRREGIAREKALEALVKRLTATAKPDTREKMPPFIRDLYRAAAAGVLTREAFLDAYAAKYGRTRWTREFAAEIGALATAVQAQPAGSWMRQRAMNALHARMGRWEGIPWRKVLTSMWYANILSGMGTQVVNVSGNAFHLMQRTLQVLVTQPRHFIPFLRGMAAGAQQGLREGGAAFRKGEPVMRAAGQWAKEDALELLWMSPNSELNFAQKLAKYGAASWGRYVFRTLTAADAFFYNTAAEGKAWALMSRAGGDVRKAAGMDAASWQRHLAGARADMAAAGVKDAPARDIRRRAYERALQARDAETQAQAGQWGARATYNYDPEGAFGILHDAVQAAHRYLDRKEGAGAAVAAGVVRMFVPFSRIVSNIADVSADWTPIGIARGLAGSHLVRSKGQKFTGIERAERLAAGIIGTGLMGAIYALASGSDEDDDRVQFMLYGQGPADPARRAAMPRGWKPSSIKIGNTYYSYEGTPLVFAFSIIGTALDQKRYGRQRGEDGWSRAQALMAAAPKSMLNAGVLSSLSQTLDMLEGKKKPGGFLGRQAAAWIPGSAFLRDVAIALDPQKVDTATFMSTLQSYIPVLRGNAAPMLNAFGEPVQEPGPWIISRIARQQDRTDADAVWLMQNKLHIPMPDSEIAVGQWLQPSDKTRLPSETLARIADGYLTPEERNTFLRTTGPLIRRAVQFHRHRSEAGQKVKQSDLNRSVEVIRRQGMRELIR